MEDQVLEKGSRGLVPIRTDIEVINVVWSLDPPPSRKLLVILDYYDGEWKTFNHYSRGLFDIDKNLSLIIKDVRIEDGATYYCTVGENGTRQAFTNSTAVKIYGNTV